MATAFCLLKIETAEKIIMLQELLTYAIEVVIVVGFGAILVDHISKNCISISTSLDANTCVSQSTPQPAPASVTPAETLPLEPIRHLRNRIKLCQNPVILRFNQILFRD
ncbi:MAG: hypothetical protein ICV85_18625 [Tolypothrix sp. T3-bin4]|nr:hypothetical protein [Tolypothrix sp. T3-bin4]